jgi:hypothetical protein
MEFDPSTLIIAACEIWCMNIRQLVQYGHLSENRLKVPISSTESLKKLVADSQNMLFILIITVSITTFYFISRKIDSNSESTGGTVDPFDEFVSEFEIH